MEFSCKSAFIYILVLSHIFVYTPGSYAAVPKFHAQKILIQSIDADEEEFENFIKSNAQYISLESLRPEVDTQAPEQIRSLQQLANSEFLGEDPSKSAALYTQIIAMALDQDWDEESRKTIFTSFFRLAQLQPEDSKELIRKAILFDLSQSPDPELVPLSLQEQFAKIKSDLEKEFIQLTPSSTKTFYVNGVLGHTTLHPQSLYRVTYVSNIYGVKTEIIKGEEANDIFPFGTPIAQGDCRNMATVSSDIKKLRQSFVFSSKNCAPKSLATVAQSTQYQMQKSESQLSDTLPAKSVASQSVDLSLYPSSINTDHIADASSSLLDNTSKSRLTPKQKKWIMVLSGVAALTLGAMLIHKQNDKSNDYAPVEAKGF